MDNPPDVKIKGIRDGLLIRLGKGTWEDVHEEMLLQLDEKAEFLRGARLAVELGDLKLRAAELGKLRSEFSERDLTLWAVISSSEATRKIAEDFGLVTRIEPRQSHTRSYRSGDANQMGEKALFLRGPIRSGFNLQHVGSVVVFGDVNPGAEIIATGSVIIWGRLNGLVHAGFEGDETAVVCALELTPIRLRISGNIAVLTKRSGKSQPEVARLLNGEVVVKVWNLLKKK